MKELSIEEKVKRYDEAIETARKINSGEGVAAPPDWTICEVVFPELKESEDERIRKELLEHCKNQAKPYIQTGNKYPQIQSWITWLEKQGKHSIYNVPSREVILAIWDLGNEWKGLTNGSISTEYGTQIDYIQKHWHESEYYLRVKQGKQKLDKVEPKFKAGDWITNGIDVCKIKNIDLNEFNYIFENGISDISLVDNICHLWTIQDAKDGDVLHCWIDGYEFILIFNCIKDGYVNAFCHLYNNLDSFSEEPTTMFCRTIQGHFTPATKEQRDTLFAKIKEAGYEWDNEKKELKKIVQKPTDDKLPEFKDKLCELFQRFRWYKDEPPTNGDILEYIDAHIQELLAIVNKQKSITPKFKINDVIKYNQKQWTIIGIDINNHCYDLDNDECVDFDTADYNFELVEQKTTEWL